MGVLIVMVMVVLGAACGVERGRADLAPALVPSGWHRVTMCNEAGAVTVHVPSSVEFDGPRRPRNFEPPANVTYSWGYALDGQIRYDAFVLENVYQYGGGDRQVAKVALHRLNGAPESVRIRSLEEQRGHVVGSYDEEYDGRDYRFRFLVDDGDIYAVGVGVYEGTPRPIIDRAKGELDQMWRSLQVAGLDGVARSACEAPLDEPG